MKEIILADDDPGMRDIFQILLKRAGYLVTIYPNGEALMNNDFKIPDMFILDKQLSGINGLKVCRFLKEQESTKNIPVIIISASPYTAGSAEEAGANEYVEKPFKTKDLLDLLNKYLNTN
jgi:CheY-like chemotaxis protein